MDSLSARRLFRTLQVVAALALSFSGCTCAGNAPPPAAPTATAPPVAAATAVPPATAPAAAAPPAAAPAAPAAVQPAPQAPMPAAAPSSSECEAYVEVLSGRRQDAAMLSKPEVRKLASPDLVICGAVFSDSDDLCKQTMGIEQGPIGACLQMRALFHELRAYPGKPSYLFTEFDWQRTRGIPALTQFADSLQTALRAGTLEACESVGDGAGICRAYVTGDKSKCAVTGALAEVEFSLPDEKEGDPKSYKVKDVAVQGCRENIESRAFLSKGLEAIAASGPPRERELAKAALRQPDACAALVKTALEACTNPPDAVRPTEAPPQPEGGAPPQPPADAPQGANAQG